MASTGAPSAPAFTRRHWASEAPGTPGQARPFSPAQQSRTISADLANRDPAHVTFQQQVLLVYPGNSEARLPDIRAFAAERNILLHEFDSERFLAQPGRCLDHAEHVVVVVADDDISEYVNLAKTLNFSLGI